ncbi:MAG: hypothetical protein M9926_16045 [Lentimicrobium sp.]|uniref:hypothetical protein n=1 Tax=Lentimicrobium sp. TaxID=2034841 RepID=UPI0025CCC4CC|nr:hypothetical protein [Lentimicrobium sp.]MCO5258258.1 hypothetical protein [Lentimicrobium sp.]
MSILIKPALLNAFNEVSASWNSLPFFPTHIPDNGIVGYLVELRRAVEPDIGCIGSWLKSNARLSNCRAFCFQSMIFKGAGAPWHLLNAGMMFVQQASQISGTGIKPDGNCQCCNEKYFIFHDFQHKILSLCLASGMLSI